LHSREVDRLMTDCYRCRYKLPCHLFHPQHREICAVRAASRLIYC